MKVNLASDLILAAVLGVGTLGSLPRAQAADTARVAVQADQPGLRMPSTLHGIFFEDINYAADGGLYAELVQNRSFEHRDPLYSWRESSHNGSKGALSVESDAPLNA